MKSNRLYLEHIADSKKKYITTDKFATDFDLGVTQVWTDAMLRAVVGWLWV